VGGLVVDTADRRVIAQALVVLARALVVVAGFFVFALGLGLAVRVFLVVSGLGG